MKDRYDRTSKGAAGTQVDTKSCMHHESARKRGPRAAYGASGGHGQPKAPPPPCARTRGRTAWSTTWAV